MSLKDIFHSMVAANYDHRMRLHSSHEHMMSEQAFAHEFKTIHLDIGRQSGKTSMMLELARPSDLIVVGTFAEKDYLYANRGSCRAEIQTLGSLYHYYRYRGLGDSWVWIDEPSKFGASLNAIYDIAPAGLYIKLGK